MQCHIENRRSTTNDVDDESEIESVLLAEEEDNKAEGVALEQQGRSSSGVLSDIGVWLLE